MTTTRSSTRQPALDGLRGASVGLVLLFHGGWGRWSGGYLGVSVFFTLSGFLITRLLVTELDERGTIDLGRFWRRRLRRLLPASAACLSAVTAIALAGGWDGAVELDRDLFGAATQLANWFQLAGSTGYAEQIAGGRGPIDHFWSLAIEEQFFWCWPLLVLVAARFGRVRAVVTATAVASVVAAPVIARLWGAEAAYWSTPARAGEIALGALLAVWLPGHADRVERHARWAGPVAIATIVACAMTWPAAGGPADVGALPLFAVASATLIACLGVPSRLTRAFAWRPLVALGSISYGVYLAHWPIFLLLRDVGSSRLATFTLQVGVSLAVATISAVVLERPVLARPVRRTDWAFAGVATVALVLAAAVLPIATADPFADPEHAAGQLRMPAVVRDEPGPRVRSADAAAARALRRTPIFVSASTSARVSTSLSSPAPIPTGAPAAPRRPDLDDLAALAARPLPPAPAAPVRVLVVGDSIAWSLGNGLVAWAEEHPDQLAVGQAIAISCGFIRGGEVPAHDGRGYAGPCDELLDRRLPAAIDELAPDVVVLMTTRTDVERRVWDDAEGVLDNADPRFLARQLEDYRSLTERVLAGGVEHVVWIPPLTARQEDLPYEPMMDPDAIARAQAVVRDAVAAGPPEVVLVDLPAWYAAGGFDDDTARPDGIHFHLEPAHDIAERLLAPVLVRLALDGPVRGAHSWASQRAPS